MGKKLILDDGKVKLVDNNDISVNIKMSQIVDRERIDYDKLGYIIQDKIEEALGNMKKIKSLAINVCWNCGHDIDMDQKFCEECGIEL